MSYFTNRLMSLLGFKITANNQVTYEEIENFIKTNRNIIIVNKKVYDITLLVQKNNHPGGIDCLIKKNGKDCTEDLMMFHSRKAKELLKYFYIGDLKN
jgi:cytochrome b involved in lipid metabolism